eukprot:CAMPEP_0179113660 /NCGR_PEP_ID=MMETSP0796-20121207/53187_1 /TAXON_ID=73915 /ORGANISM="Pyrodinium bahamense, Strain pbaha01" /LENGTH=31 /DNA_ID= /DNA_START= /DNA_END= /DNA_ORIENTATION=
MKKKVEARVPAASPAAGAPGQGLLSHAWRSE